MAGPVATEEEHKEGVLGETTAAAEQQPKEEV